MKPTMNNNNRVLLLLITTWLTLFFSFSLLLVLLSPLLVSTSSLPITVVDAFSSTSTSIYNKFDNNKATSTSTSTRLRLLVRSSSSSQIENEIENASTVTRCTKTTTTRSTTTGAIAKATLMRMTKQDDSLMTTSSSTKAVTTTTTIITTQPFSSTIVSSLRLSWLLFLFSTPAVAVTTTVVSSPSITVPSTFVVAAAAADTLNVDSTNYETPEGISAITKSAIGTSVREQVVKSAKLVDSLDLKWERFSDSLRDQKKCDPLTNRRLFDNGIRSDGTPRGNPVLGALCTAVPLQAIDETLITTVLTNAFDSAAYDIISNIVNQGDANVNHDVSNGGVSSTTSTTMDRSALQDLVEQTRQRLEPAFRRAATATSSPSAAASASVSSPASAIVIVDEATKRQQYNLEVYTRVRAYGEALTKSVVAASSSSSTSSTPDSKSTSASSAAYKLARKEGKKLDLLWGRNLLTLLAGPASQKYEFQTPFPLPTDTTADPLKYNIKELTNALGAVEVALDKLQQGGLIGHWEISIPEDDFGEVVTIAIDDDVGLSAQILAREDAPTVTASLSGSPVVAMVRSAMEERAHISYATLDVFYIDPSTTKNELYNPTQLLISLRNVGEEQ